MIPYLSYVFNNFNDLNIKVTNKQRFKQGEFMNYGASASFRLKKSNNKLTLKPHSLMVGNQTHTLPKQPGMIANELHLSKKISEFYTELTSGISCIHTPVILTPKNNDIDVYGIVTSSPYKAADNYIGTHYASEWQFATDENFTNIVDTSGLDTVNLTRYNFIPTLFSTIYFMRVRYYSKDFVSNWSSVVSFTSKATYIQPPTLVINGVVDKTSLTPSFTVSGFTVINGDDILSSVSYDIALDSNFDNIVLTVENDTTATTNIVVTTKLDKGTTYYIRAKYVGERFISAYSEPYQFITATITEAPILSGNSIINEKNTLEITIDNYDTNCSYYLTPSLGTATLNREVISWELPTVNADTNVTLTVVAINDVFGLDESAPSIHYLNVLDVPITTDQALVYNSTNFNTAFLQTNTLTDNGSLTTQDLSILDTNKSSTLTELFILNKYCNVNIGDVLKTDTNKFLKVSGVYDDGATATVSGLTYKTNYWVTVNETLTEVPSKLFLINGRAKSIPLTQSAGEKDFASIENLTVKERVFDIMDKQKTSNLSNIYIDNKLIELKPGDKVINSNGGIMSVESVNDDGAIETINVISVAAGVNHSVAIATNGYVYVCGDNTYGQLGINTITSTKIFTRVGIRGVAVACGDYTTYVIKENYELYGAGKGIDGQFGNSILANKASFGTCNVFCKNISANGDNAIIISLDGTAYTTGKNTYGQIGDGTTINKSTWFNTGIKPRSVHCGKNNMGMILQDYTICVSGDNSYYQTALVNDSNPNTKNITMELKEVIYNASGTFTVPTDAINNEFYVGCTGGGGGGGYDFNQGGLVHTGSGGGGSGRTSGVFTLTPGTNIPVTVGAGGVYAGGYVGTDGGASVFGSYLTCSGGKGGVSGVGGKGVNGGGDGGSYSAGTASSCAAMLTLKAGAIDNTTKLYTAKSYAGGTGTGSYSGGGGGCYGPGTNGGLGTVPPVTNSGAGSASTTVGGSAGKVVIYYYVFNIPVSKTPLRVFTSIVFKGLDISFGEYHTLIRGVDDYLYVVGRNNYGQLGTGDYTDLWKLKKLTHKAKYVKAGGYYSMFIATDNYVYGSGYNNYGQLGIGDLVNKTTFNMSIQAKQIALAYNHVLLVDFTNRVLAVGINTYGQLGTGDNVIKKVFTNNSLNLIAKTVKLFKPNYWITLPSEISVLPTKLYAISKPYFNSVAPVILSATLTNTNGEELITTYEAMDILDSNEIITELEIPNYNLVTEIAASLYKLL